MEDSGDKLGSSVKKILILLIAAFAFLLAEHSHAGSKTKDCKASPKPQVKLPAFENVVFSVDDKRFFVWLNEFYPEEVLLLMDFEKDAEAFHSNFKHQKSRWRRLYGAYKRCPRYGKALVAERDLRLKRMAVLDKLKNAKTDKKSLQAELNKIVSKEFDVAVSIKRIMYEVLRKKIKRLEKELNRRELEVKKLIEHKEDEVNKRVEDLIKGDEKINWD